MVTAIDPSAIRTTGKTLKSSSAATDFSVFMGAMAPAGGEGTVQAGADPQHAVVTQAAMTGLSGASSQHHAPYLGSTSGVMGLSSQFSPSNATPAYGQGVPVADAGNPAAPGAFENPSQEFQEREYILNKMHSDSLNMLTLQAEVQNQNRQFTMVSNMLQSRDRTLHNMIQNMRGM